MPRTTSTTDTWSKRLLQELNTQSRSPLPACLLLLRPVSDAQLDVWEAVLRGVEGTAYQDGQWKLSIQIPPSYPLSAPKIKFETPVCHPNVAFQTGEICLELLQSAWTPVYTIASTLEAVHHLLQYPDVDSPLNVDVALLLRTGDRIGAEALVRWCCWEWRWEGEEGAGYGGQGRKEEGGGGGYGGQGRKGEGGGYAAQGRKDEGRKGIWEGRDNEEGARDRKIDGGKKEKERERERDKEGKGFWNRGKEREKSRERQ